MIHTNYPSSYSCQINTRILFSFDSINFNFEKCIAFILVIGKCFKCIFLTARERKRGGDFKAYEFLVLAKNKCSLQIQIVFLYDYTSGFIELENGNLFIYLFTLEFVILCFFCPFLSKQTITKNDLNEWF